MQMVGFEAFRCFLRFGNWRGEREPEVVGAFALEEREFLGVEQFEEGEEGDDGVDAVFEGQK
jgi:hypothetical protein